MKRDITTSEDIHLLVDSFYEKVRLDASIGYMFNDIAQTNWEEHLPKMYGFWEILLLGQPGTTSNPMEKHININAQEKITEQHFEKWVQIWFETIDEHFEGPNSDLAKERTYAIRNTMHQRIRMSEQTPPNA
jgi:hemoglobin